ncbi:hypothetical protein GCM10010329_59560 [Streptomyces spiroverticillatus]|uniref:Uncharacterized protein n=1 Tax=Streptomyces finlayi TaxID=67296 RepID=A0A919CD94_9ACTN|nr:hypothetical protein GCM10010329_59560 [Streptomyces spiroverticillatus]GHD09165.1 hypothetical protein GCM10010334_63220 [Streptomyces finlayi]
MHERGVQALREESVERGVGLGGGDAVGLRDLGQLGGRTGLEVDLDPRKGREDGQVRLLRDVAEADDADLHGGLPLWC